MGAGEGSRGGHVVGHTASGNAIYAAHEAERLARHATARADSSGSRSDHKAAAEAHGNAARAYKSAGMENLAEHHAAESAGHSRDAAAAKR